MACAPAARFTVLVAILLVDPELLRDVGDEVFVVGVGTSRCVINDPHPDVDGFDSHPRLLEGHDIVHRREAALADGELEEFLALDEASEDVCFSSFRRNCFNLRCLFWNM